MSNQLAMDKAQSIKHLHSLGWSQRRIARTLGVDRKSVRRHLGLEDPKGTAPSRQAPTAPDEIIDASKGAKAPTGPEQLESLPEHVEVAKSESPSRSDCEPYREQIVTALEQGLSAQRIYQDLVSEHGFTGSYWSVNRYVQRLGKSSLLPFRRLEVAPGEEAQIDFGTGAPYLDATGKKRRSHVLRVVLSHSRKAYSEVVTRQTTENFIRALENAFHAFGGVPRTLVIDNLKAAVTNADWFDPELNPKLLDFCRHYGVSVMPTKPRTPRHKGKVERGVAYVQDNALKARVFGSVAEQNEYLANWERTVADTRIHGTIKRHVGKLFQEVERPTLQPLPRERFPFYYESRRTVSRDGHIEVAKSFYSVPPEYVTRKVWTRWNSHTVRIFNDAWQQIALHARVEEGKYSTHGAHIASEKINNIERGVAFLLKKVQIIGPHASQWAERMLELRDIRGARVLQGLLALTRKHSSARIERACEAAWRSQGFRLRDVRSLIDSAEPVQATLDFIDQHPIIRSPEEYGQFVHDVIQGAV